jgi:hypothetical protein
MLHMRSALAVTTAVALLVAVAGPAEGAAKPCARKGSHTVKSNRLVRVYEVANKDGGKNLYGCLRSDDRRQRLAHGYDDNYVASGSYDRVKLSGVRVRWRFTETDDSCKANCPPDYNPTSRSNYERNLKTRKTTVL